MEESFSLWVPMIKAKPQDEGDSAYRIRGVASTETRDWQGETVVQSGIDFNPFLKSGHFNWNHQPGPENIIGEPTAAVVVTVADVPGYRILPHQTGHEPCLYLEGVLYKGVTRADAVWKLMTTLAKGSPYDRALGYSLEGGVAARTGNNRLTRTVVRHCAVTHEPINSDSWAVLAKSALGLAADPWTPHHVFWDFDALVKSMTGEEESYREVMTLSRQMAGLTPCTRSHHDGVQFVGGTDGLLCHLVECDGWSPDAALIHVQTLKSALGG
jgi:hypothetical protein